VAVDSAGNLFVAEGHHTIRKITPAGEVKTLAGLAGSQGTNDGVGYAARFNGPTGVAVDSAGNVYVADTYNHTIRKITPNRAVTTLAGRARSPGFVNGTGRAARFNYPNGLAVDNAGNVYVAESNNNAIRKVTPGGVVTTLARSLNFPQSVAEDSAGNVYVGVGEAIQKVTPSGVVTTLAGVVNGGCEYADGIGSDARFGFSAGVAVDSEGTVYVADGSNKTIRKITPAGVVTTLAGLAGGYSDVDDVGPAARFDQPRDVAVDSVGNAYVAESGATVRKVTPGGEVTTLAGSYQQYGNADGTGSAAQFENPWGIAVNLGGNVYVADRLGTIRKVTPAGEVTTLAGLAGASGSDDGTGSDARFNGPNGVAVDGAGNVYVADIGNATIRKITPDGTVTTLTMDTATSSSAASSRCTSRPYAGPSVRWTMLNTSVSRIITSVWHHAWAVAIGDTRDPI